MVDVLVPIPITMKSVSYSQKPLNKSKDAIYGNDYIVWKVKLGGDERKELIYESDLHSSPAWLSKNDTKWVFDDYKRLDRGHFKDYLSSNGYLKPGDRIIREKALKIKGNERNVMKVMKKLASFVVSHLRYGNPIMGLYKADYAYRHRKVDCGGFSTLFASMAMATGVPCRIVSGFWVGYGKSEMHAWAEFMLPDGKWIPADLSVQQLSREGKSRKSGRFGFTGSDRIIMSYGCDIPVVIDGKNKRVDILQNPYLFSNHDLSQVEVRVECFSNRLKR